MGADPARLQAFFSRPGLQRLLDRLRTRRERGRPLTGTLTLEDALEDERRAIDQILRRATSSGASLSVPLDLVLRELQTAKLAHSWEEALQALCGPPNPMRTLATEKAKAWDECWEHATSVLPAGIAFQNWLEGMRRDGSLKRLSRDDPETARTWIEQAIAVFNLVPLESEPLASLAARVACNSHALDHEYPVATIVLRGIALFYKTAMPASSGERRALWARAGVVCDELSAPVLTLNLSVAEAAPLTAILSAACAGAVPLHLTTRLLLATDWTSAVVPPRVFVCENSSIVALAVQRFGAKSAPLICLDGEPKTAGWLLLKRLCDAGTEIFYHGDFDWRGLAIAGRVIARVGAKPWRFTADDYLAAPGTERLIGSPEPAPWCPNLTSSMRKRGIAIHEEALAEPLINDLGTV